MRLNDTAIQKFLNRIAGKSCESCGSSNWSYDNRVYEIREFTGGGLNIGGASIAPFLIVTCGTCANTRFHNVISAGLMKPDGSAID